MPWNDGGNGGGSETPKLTWAAMQALPSPSQGDVVFCIDDYLETDFTYNSRTGLWEAPGFVDLLNEGVDLTQYAIVNWSDATDFAVTIVSGIEDIDRLGVAMFASLNNARVLVKYIGRTRVQKLFAISVARNDFIYTGNVDGQADADNNTGRGDFANAMEAVSSSTDFVEIFMYPVASGL